MTGVVCAHLDFPRGACDVTDDVVTVWIPLARLIELESYIAAVRMGLIPMSPPPDDDERG